MKLPRQRVRQTDITFDVTGRGLQNEVLSKSVYWFCNYQMRPISLLKSKSERLTEKCIVFFFVGSFCLKHLRVDISNLKNLSVIFTQFSYKIHTGISTVFVIVFLS
jgi:hypothetical protein